MKAKTQGKLLDDEYDFSLLQLEEVPVNEIAKSPKGTTIDLSNNKLRLIPDRFSTLLHIHKLDLSKNSLSSLPESFGQLHNLRHLDLYSNQLEHLPLSFGQLKRLKWLDLKNNPLVPALAKAAGPCITSSDCFNCAKKVVALLQSMESRLNLEKREQEAQELLRKAAEEKEKKRLRALKQKEKQRNKPKPEAEFSNEPSPVKYTQEQREQKSSGQGYTKSTQKEGSGFCSWILKFMFSFLLVNFALLFAAIWIYGQGNLDRKSVESSLLAIQRDCSKVFTSARHYLPSNDDLSALYDEVLHRHRLLTLYINQNLGPYFCQAKTYFNEAAKNVQTWWIATRPLVAERLREFSSICIKVAGLALQYCVIGFNLALEGIYYLSAVCYDLGTQAMEKVDGYLNE